MRGEHREPPARFLQGCDPGPDTDHDGVPDWQDRCPIEPESYNGFEDTDGCPDKRTTVVREVYPKIEDRVYFGLGRANLTDDAEGVLDFVAGRRQRLRSQIARIEVGGHACSSEPATNALSLRRAEAVRCELVRRGVAAERLSVRGYGAEQQGSSKLSKVACASMQRVEFQVLEYLLPPWL